LGFEVVIAIGILTMIRCRGQFIVGVNCKRRLEERIEKCFIKVGGRAKRVDLLITPIAAKKNNFL
jgi:hypothetical protein